MTETAKKKKSLTCTGRPATSAYARAWGTVVSPTVRPASRSICSHLRLYLGSQERIGTQAFKVLEEQQPLTTDIRSSSGWSIVYRWDIREENLEISGGKVQMTANKWDEAIVKCLHLISTGVWLLQRKATYKKMMGLPPLWLTSTHFWLPSSPRFGFACVLTGPAAAAGQMWTIISLRKCCMFCLLQRINHILPRKCFVITWAQIYFSEPWSHVSHLMMRWWQVLKTGICLVIFSFEAIILPEITKRTSLKITFLVSNTTMF